MTAMTDAPEGREARLDILTTGYVGDRVASTVLLVRDGDAVVVVDPGMVASRSVILDPLQRLGVRPEQVTDIVISHHHPDHTINIALFPEARVHDVMAIYSGDVWEDRPAEGYLLSGSVRLIETPGHTPQDISTVIGTADGIAVATHAWWAADGPAEDPFAQDATVLAASRARILAVADLVVPGHGAPFTPDAATPR
jgi:glyoxylase-like metal-dependent hydrolase (beta-lactamase superfamily II)